MKKIITALSVATLLFTSSSIGQVEAVETTSGTSYPQGEAFENGGYNIDAGLPVAGNWSYNLPFAGTNTNQIKWDKDILSYSSTPTVDKDGNIYYVNLDYTVVSYDKNGVERWNYPMGTSTSSTSSIVIGVDGTLYVSGGPYLYAFNNDGTIKWKSDVSGRNFKQTPAIDKNGIIYVVDNFGKELYAFNNDGTLKWKTEGLNDSVGDNKSPLIANDGTIYIQGSANTGKLTAIDKNGQIKWQISSSGYLSNITLLPDGRVMKPIYNSGSKGVIRLINKDGSIGNSITLVNTTSSKFAIYSEYSQEIIVSDDEKISSYNLDGTNNWNYQTTGEIRTVPVIDKNGVIYFTSNEGILNGLNPNGELKWTLNLKEYYQASTLGFPESPNSIGVDKNGTFYTVVKINKTTGSSYKFIAIGDDKVPENYCVGYLELIEQKIQNGTITQEEIDDAQLRLNNTLDNLNQIENQ